LRHKNTFGLVVEIHFIARILETTSILRVEHISQTDGAVEMNAVNAVVLSISLSLKRVMQKVLQEL